VGGKRFSSSRRGAGGCERAGAAGGRGAPADDARRRALHAPRPPGAPSLLRLCPFPLRAAALRPGEPAPAPAPRSRRSPRPSSLLVRQGLCLDEAALRLRQPGGVGAGGGRRPGGEDEAPARHSDCSFHHPDTGIGSACPAPCAFTRVLRVLTAACHGHTMPCDPSPWDPAP